MILLGGLAIAAIVFGAGKSDSSRWRLRSGAMTCEPGVWVRSAAFAKDDSADPVVLNEDVSSEGIRIRSWYHMGRHCDWVSTNKGMGSPDGPYWVSQVQSERVGACVGEKYCVGLPLEGVPSDTEIVLTRGGRELTVGVKAGKVVSLMVFSDGPPVR